MERKMIQVEEKVPLLIGIPLSFQHLFAMFGASVLVPTLFKIDPAVVLLMNGAACHCHWKVDGAGSPSGSTSEPVLGALTTLPTTGVRLLRANAPLGASLTLSTGSEAVLVAVSLLLAPSV